MTTWRREARHSDPIMVDEPSTRIRHLAQSDLTNSRMNRTIWREWDGNSKAEVAYEAVMIDCQP